MTNRSRLPRRFNPIGLLAVVPRLVSRLGQSLFRLLRVHKRCDLVAILDATQRALDSVAEGIIIFDSSRRITTVNPAACSLLGYGREELVGRSVDRIRAQVKGASHSGPITCPILESLLSQRAYSSDREQLSRKDGLLIPVNLTALPVSSAGRPTHVFVVFHDMTGRRAAESRGRLMDDVLREFNTDEGLHTIVGRVLELIKRATGLESVGLRLREGSHFPFFQDRNSRSVSHLTEFSSCVNRERSGTRTPMIGEPVLHCTCELVAAGQGNPHIPCFTSGGSFWTNRSSELYSLETSDGSYLNMCNRCVDSGSESVALIPLASRDGAIGILQLGDRRPGCLTLEMIEFFEDLSHIIALAVKRRQAEENLCQKERLYHILFECARDAIVTIAPPASTLVSANAAARKLFGAWSESELASRRLWDLCPPVQPDGVRSSDRALEVIAAAMREGSHLFEWTQRRSNGELATCSVLLTRIEEGNRTFLQATIRDVSEQRQIEADRALNLQRMEAILELSHMSECTDDSLLASVVEDAIRLTRSEAGYLAELNEQDQQLSVRCWSALPLANGAAVDEPTDRAEGWRSVWDECIRSRAPVIANRVSACCGGTDLVPGPDSPLHRHAVVPLFSGSQLVAVAGVVNKQAAYDQSDVRQLQLLMEGWQQLEERIHASQQLQMARELVTAEALKLRSMIEGMAEGIVVADDQDVITEANRWLLDKTGLCRDQVVGSSLWDLQLDHESSSLVRAIVESFKSGQRRVVQVVNRELLGMQLSLRLQPIYEAGDYRGIILNAVDVTDIVRAREAAEEATRVKSQFLANMSHEIRTPMTAILGFNEIVLDETNQADVRDAAQIVKRNGEQLLRLINDILDISRIEAGELRVEIVRWSPRQLIADVISLLHVKAAAKGLALMDEYEGPLPDTVATDPDRLRQILINLAGNAIKFTDQGSVRIVTRLLGDAEGGPQLRIQVVDTGVGIRSEDVGKLFGAFVQVDGSASRRHDGTGLGLAISRRLARALGGNITVTSAVGQGSTFTVTVATGLLEGVPSVDLQSSQAADYDARNDLTSVPEGKTGIHILLVDDIPDNQRLISSLLRQAGYDVVIAEDGKEACDRVLGATDGGHADQTRSADQFDLILMDMQMPVLDGYQATRRLRTAGYSGPIVALTAHAMRGDREKCLAAGCDDYLPKPVNRPALLDMLRKWTCHSRTRTPAEVGAGNPSSMNECP